MKHINESIIGRKNANRGLIKSLKDLKDFDIVEIATGELFVVFLQPAYIKLLNTKFHSNSGIIVFTDPTNSPNKYMYISLDDYNNDLEYYKTHTADMITIWRSSTPGKYIDLKNIDFSISLQYLRSLIISESSDYKIIWKK